MHKGRARNSPYLIGPPGPHSSPKGNVDSSGFKKAPAIEMPMIEPLMGLLSPSGKILKEGEWLTQQSVVQCLSLRSYQGPSLNLY